MGFVVYRLRTVVVAAAAALLLTSVLAPAAGWLRAHRWPPLLATWAVFLAAAGLAAVIASTVLPQVVGYMGQVGTQLQAAARELQSWLVEGPLQISPDQLDRYLGMLRDGIGANASALALRVLSGASLEIISLTMNLKTSQPANNPANVEIASEASATKCECRVSR